MHEDFLQLCFIREQVTCLRTPNCCCHIIKQDNRQVQINEAVGYLFFSIAIKADL